MALKGAKEAFDEEIGVSASVRLTSRGSVIVHSHSEWLSRLISLRDVRRLLLPLHSLLQSFDV